MSALSEVTRLNQTVTATILGKGSAIPADRWTTPRASGKWSPAQVVEHLTKSYEGHRDMASGRVPAGNVSVVKQWIARTIFLPKLFKLGDFPANRQLKSPEFILPSDLPIPRQELLTRFEIAAKGLEADLQRLETEGKDRVMHPFFGPLKLADFLHFVAIHARHHEPQIVAAN